MGLLIYINLFFLWSRWEKGNGTRQKEPQGRFIKRTALQDSSNGNVQTNGVGEGVVKDLCRNFQSYKSSQHSWVC